MYYINKYIAGFLNSWLSVRKETPFGHFSLNDSELVALKRRRENCNPRQQLSCTLNLIRLPLTTTTGFQTSGLSKSSDVEDVSVEMESDANGVRFDSEKVTMQLMDRARQKEGCGHPPSTRWEAQASCPGKGDEVYVT